MKNLVHKVLETPFWPEDLQAMKRYFRTHDDCDGERGNGITVTISTDGDAWVETCPGGCRFRMPMTGGGLSPRVRNALLLLAVAIKLDNQEHTIPANSPDQARLQPSPEAGCSAFIVHDMTGSVPDQECKTRESAEAWVRQLTEARPNARPVIQPNKEIDTKAANEQQHGHPMTLRECAEAEEPLLDMESVSDRTKSVPDWVAEEIRTTWRAARDAGSQLESFRIIERMVDRLGYGRTENNPSLAPNEEPSPKESAP